MGREREAGSLLNLDPLSLLKEGACFPFWGERFPGDPEHLRYSGALRAHPYIISAKYSEFWEAQPLLFGSYLPYKNHATYCLWGSTPFPSVRLSFIDGPNRIR